MSVTEEYVDYTNMTQRQEDITYITGYANMRIPLEHLELYYRILVALSDYGEDMLEDCKASCTDRDSGIIECFNMFSAACAKYELGDIKAANVIFSYVDSTLNLKYKNIVIPDEISFPVEEENIVVYFDFKNKKYYIQEGIPIPIESIEIEGSSNITGLWAQYTVTLNPENTTETEIKWEVIEGEGSQYAFIDDSGKLYLRPNAYNSIIKIKATSVENDSIYNIKVITGTYSTSVQGQIEIITGETLFEYNTPKDITAIVHNALSTPIRLELYEIDSNDNLIFVNSAQNTLQHTFTITVSGIKEYIVKAVFSDSTEIMSTPFTLNGIPCCYIGEAPNTEVGYMQVLGNDNYKLDPMLDIASELGKEYPVYVTNDGNYIYIIVPRIEGHMQIDEVRLDETNMSEGFYFDIDTTINDVVFNGVQYGVYGLKLRGNGFVAQDNPYRLLITKSQEL